MHPTLSTLLERALSCYLAQDPETLQQLNTLSGKVIKITLSTTNTELYLFPNATGIQVKNKYSGQPDAEITGPILTLLRMRSADPKTTTQLAKEIQIKGDSELAQTFSQILQQIQIDWEEPLSKFTGDTIAHQIGQAARGFKRWGLRAKKSLQMNVTEYLQEEARHLPPREEIEDFFSEIRRLENDVARLEARWHRLDKTLIKT